MNKLGGIGLIAAGVLFLLSHVLQLVAGAVPANGTAILAWVASNQLALSFVSETLFFAVMILVPGVIALYESLRSVDKIKASLGCGVIAVAIPVLAMLLIVHGRLVYPVYGLRVRSPDVAELLVAIFYGGLHAVWLLFAPATIVLSLAMQRGPCGKGVVYLGLATGALDVVASYPDLIGPALAPSIRKTVDARQ